MTALWILLGIAGFFAFLLIIRVGADVNFDPEARDSFVLKVGAGGLFFQIMPNPFVRRRVRRMQQGHYRLRKHVKRRHPVLSSIGNFFRMLFRGIWRGIKALLRAVRLLPAEDKPKKAKKKTKKSKKDAHKADKPKRSLQETLGLILALLKGVKRALHPLFKAIHLSLDAHLVVATGDAYKTAMQYGEICAALSQLTPLLYKIFSVHACSIHADADFTAEKLRASGHVRVTTSLGGLLGAGLVFLFTFLRARPKKKRAGKTGRKGHPNERASDQRHDGPEHGENP